MTVRLCLYVDPASRHCDSNMTQAMGPRECPHPHVLDEPNSGLSTQQCISCLYDWSAENEPLIDGEWWGPVRTQAEILRR